MSTVDSNSSLTIRLVLSRGAVDNLVAGCQVENGVCVLQEPRRVGRHHQSPFSLAQNLNDAPVDNVGCDFGVERLEGTVHHCHLRLGVQTPGDGDPFALTPAKQRAPCPHRGGIPKGKERKVSQQVASIDNLYRELRQNKRAPK